MNILMNETSSTIKINGKMGKDDVSLTLNLKGNYNKKDAPKINESVNIDEISDCLIEMDDYRFKQFNFKLFLKCNLI